MKIAKTKSFERDVGIQPRSRGTVQSDRWRGKMSALVGGKLISIVPVLGWWDQREPLRTRLVALAAEQDGPALTLRVRVREREITAAVHVSLDR